MFSFVGEKDRLITRKSAFVIMCDFYLSIYFHTYVNNYSLTKIVWEHLNINHSIALYLFVSCLKPQRLALRIFCENSMIK
jgi:hypothetical protein